MKKRKKKGIVGIDRSGSKADFPIVVVSVYSDKVGNFESAIKEVRKDLNIKYGFIKGKDFKPSQYEKAIQILKRNNIHFMAYIVSRKTFNKIKRLMKYQKNWVMKSEAYLWYESTRFLVNRLKSLPAEVFYERTYTGSGTDVFDDVFKKLMIRRLGSDTDSVMIGEKTSPYIMVADWVAHFFYSNPGLSVNFKNDSMRCKLKYIEKDLKEIFNLERQGCPPSTRSSRPNRSPTNVRTIQKYNGSIFKTFGLKKMRVIKEI